MHTCTQRHGTLYIQQIEKYIFFSNTLRTLCIRAQEKQLFPKQIEII